MYNRKFGPARYARAKLNLEKKYLLVGITEELDKFFLAAEKLLPRIFKGAYELYMASGK